MVVHLEEVKGVPEELEEEVLKVCGDAVAVHDLVDGAHGQGRQLGASLRIVLSGGEPEDDGEEPGADVGGQLDPGEHVGEAPEGEGGHLLGVRVQGDLAHSSV